MINNTSHMGSTMKEKSQGTPEPEDELFLKYIEFKKKKQIEMQSEGKSVDSLIIDE